MVVEPDVEEVTAVFAESCMSTTLGVLVLKTAIPGLQMEMYSPSKLIIVNHNTRRNEYVLCVQPTARQYWVTISGAGFEPFDIEVKAIQAGQPRYFRIIPKQ